MRTTTILRRAAAIALAALALPAGASAATVGVRVEGQSVTQQARVAVTIGTGSGTAQKYDNSGALPGGCKDDTAAQALERAVSGNWDRAAYVTTINSEYHGFSPDSWTIYLKKAGANWSYADWGICDLHLADGDELLLQAGDNMTVANWRPYSPVLVWNSVPSTPQSTSTAVSVSLKKWVVPNVPDDEDPAFPGSHWLSPAMVESDAASYKVTATKSGGPTFTATTNASGVASLAITTAGLYTLKADATTTGITGNWSRSLPTSVCVRSSSGVQPC